MTSATSRLYAAVCLCPTVSLCYWAFCAVAGAAEPIQYNHDVRPILAEFCFACHGPDSASRKADLRLDQRDAAVEMGAIEPGEPDDSGIIERIWSDDPDLQMPPPETKKQLSQAQKQLLRDWVAAGAEYEPHWSLIPPARPPVPPAVQPERVRNPIDAFIQARLARAGLQPAPEADRRTLARRLSLDLTGLPPEPALVEAFVADTAPDAYERLVDQLLQSEAWGEHRARYWLDAARYADTHGIHFDNFREIWAYRDWVIGAFNRNLPFDQFTVEQLAGDLLPEPTLAQRVATGFNRCNITTNEGGVIPEEYLVLYTRDRTETLGQVWLGMTVGCAVCHDHKFDPLSQREFYELSAFFNNTTQGAMDGNIKDTPPVVRAPLTADQPRWDALEAELPQVRGAVEARRSAAQTDHERWLASANRDQVQLSAPTETLYLHAALGEGEGRTVQIAVDGQPRAVPLAESAVWQEGHAGTQALALEGAACELPDVGDFERDQAFTCAAWIKLPPNDSMGAICARMDDTQGYRGWDFWTQRRQVGSHVIHRWPDNALKVVARSQVPANQWTHVTVTCDGSGKASGMQVYYNGQPQPTIVEADRLADTTRTAVPWKLGQRHTSSPLSGGVIQDLRIYTRALSAGEVDALARASELIAILAKPSAERTDGERKRLYDWWLRSQDATFRELQSRLNSLEKERQDIESRGTVAHVMQERSQPPMAFVLYRGEYDKRRDQVPPKTPAALPPWSEDLPLSRLGLARWLLRDDQPLTARVTVNRFWQELFGTGLVRTAGDFGVAGELPSHPELLDWLAVEFRASGWDVKRLFRLIVTSATYRQAAVTTPEKLLRDPANRLLSRGPRFRMDAEMVRDYALAASGLLVRQLGGPSVKPYQPPGVWEAVAMIGSNTRDYRPDTGPSLYRRSLYTFWKRSAPPASLDIFNAPSREVCTVRRERTNTPLQALVTLNDPQYVEAARVLAARALQEGGATDAEKLDYLMRRVAARPLREPERGLVAQSLAALLSYYQAQVDDARKLLEVGPARADASLDPATLAAWTMLTNQLMNLDEVLNK